MPAGLTYRQVAEKVRYRVGAKRTERLRFQPIINAALQKLSDKIAESPTQKSLLFTDKATITATLTSGVADLSTIVGTNAVNLKQIKFGIVLKDAVTTPLVWLTDAEAANSLLTDSLDADFVGYYIAGTKLYTHDAALSGTLKFAVPFVPTLVTLPKDLVAALEDEVVQIVKDAVGSGWIEGNTEDDVSALGAANV